MRYLEEDLNGDEWFKERVSNGADRDGTVYMPEFQGGIAQEWPWAIRADIAFARKTKPYEAYMR